MLGPRAKSLALALSFCCATALASADAAAQTRPTAALGYSPAERRAVEERLARTEAERDGLADRLGVSRRLMRAVATEVGLANPRFTDSQFFTAVETMAERAQELQADNTRLREEITRLSDPALRDPALALLGQAETALDEGRLADAEGIYAQLQELRLGEGRAAEEAWDAAVEARARTAELRLDYVTVESVRLAAADTLRERAIQAQARALTNEIEGARSRYREGLLLGRKAGFEAAITLIRTRIMPGLAREQDHPLIPDLINDLAVIYSALAQQEDAPRARQLLAESLTLLDGLAERPDIRDDPVRMASVEVNRGNALVLLGGFTSDAESIALLGRAIEQFEAALTLIAEIPLGEGHLHATTGLTLALTDLARRKDGAEANALMVRAVEVSRLVPPEAAQVNSMLWGQLQNNLGIALLWQAERRGSSADDGGLYDLAVRAFTEAQRHHDRTTMPAQWALATTNLTNALTSSAARLPPDQAVERQSRVIALLTEVETIYTREDSRVNWGIVQQNLGNAHLGIARSDAARASVHAPLALTAFENALSVVDRTAHPTRWVIAQNNLANSLQIMAQLTPGDAGNALLERAIAGYEEMLTISTRQSAPFDWSLALNNMGGAQRLLAMRVQGASGLGLLQQSLVNLELAMEVRTREAYPSDWADSQFNKAITYMALQQLSPPKETPALLSQALEAINKALTVYDLIPGSAQQLLSQRVRDVLSAAIANPALL